MKDFLNDLDAVIPEQEQFELKPLSGWEEEWYKSILPENNKISLRFKDWDNHFKGKLRDKLMVIMGYGGTMKSLFAQNIVFDNTERLNNKVIYSTMEMGATYLIDRMINMHIEGYDFQSSYEIVEEEKKKTGYAKEIYQKLSSVVDGKVYITQNSSLVCSTYDKMLSFCKEKGVKIDVLVVDGLSMMGGGGSETEVYSKNTKELKELAKKWNILVILICHVSKGNKLSDKDVSRNVRGSEKILDNCDFYVSMSKVEAPGEYENYEGCQGNARLVDKRGTGDVIDTMFKLDPKRLLMSPF